jgi:anti-sigma factor RsiW
MSCSDTLGWLDAYVDGELDAVHGVEVDRHLEGCERCRARVARTRAVSGAVRGARLYRRAPAELGSRLGASVRRPLRLGERRWARYLAVAALIACLVGIGVLTLRRPSTVVREVVDAHVRSLLAAHLLDVPTSDRHTVKPWFNGKLEYAVDVPDPSAQGFPLVGGRLDYVDGRRVAALVYRRRQHVINVFVWPCDDSGAGRRTMQGYHVLHWSRDGRCWWVVSDLAEEELEEFGRLIGR